MTDMSSLYDDPELSPSNITFDKAGDSFTGVMIRAEAIRTTYGKVAKFWFFDPANVEMTVKVLDGCSLNSHYWVFAAGMTNVGVQWKVTNNLSSTTKDYSNAIGTPFQPVQDTAAFPCP